MRNRNSMIILNQKTLPAKHPMLPAKLRVRRQQLRSKPEEKGFSLQDARNYKKIHHSLAIDNAKTKTI